MQAEWVTESTTLGGTHFISQCDSDDAKVLQTFVDDCVAKAAALLNNNLTDDGRYLLFDWSPEDKRLLIVLADEQKQTIGKDQVSCSLPNFDKQCQEEDLRFWLKDFLGVCTDFLAYSLLAVFRHHNSKHTHLL